jgi:hypothetical protein
MRSVCVLVGYSGDDGWIEVFIGSSNDEMDLFKSSEILVYNDL